jgi:hypothetical protein
VESLPSKRRILEKKERKKKRKRKKGARIEKQKRWNLIWRSSMFQKEKRKKKEDKIYKLVGEILSKERKKRDHIFLYCKIQCVASSILTHHLHYLLFLDFSLPYPHSLHHFPSTMIICHTNSL